MMPVRRNQNWLPSIFNDFFDNDWMVKANATAPAINVFETAKEYKVELAAPGMTKEDFNVHIDEENNLVISMEKKTESKEENNKDEKKEGRYLRREFSYTKFQQTMILPDDVDKEKIGAHVENGVLNITLPKFTEAEKEKAKKQKAAEELEVFVSDVILPKKQDIRKVIKGPVPSFFSGPIGSFFVNRLITDKRFHVEADRCLQCGMCASVCPVNDIEGGKGKMPSWKHNGQCLTCFSCYHHCPTHAIEFGRQTQKKGQYYYDKNK